MIRNSNTPTLSTNNTNNVYEWQIKRSYNESQGETRTKSHSFTNNIGNETYLRRSIQAEQHQPKVSELYYPSNIASLNSSINMKGPQYWKNELVDNRSEMPVRDVGLDPVSKHKLKTSTAAMSQSCKQQSYSHKKFINISKR